MGKGNGKLSDKFKHAVLVKRLQNVRSYELARNADLSASVFSGMLHDARRVLPGDKRIIKIGRRLGLRPSECFEADVS